MLTRCAPHHCYRNWPRTSRDHQKDRRRSTRRRTPSLDERLPATDLDTSSAPFRSITQSDCTILQLLLGLGLFCTSARLEPRRQNPRRFGAGHLNLQHPGKTLLTRMAIVVHPQHAIRSTSDDKGEMHTRQTTRILQSIVASDCPPVGWRGSRQRHACTGPSRDCA